MEYSSKKKCFVLMPFEVKYVEIYSEVYKSVCESNGVSCWRVDEISRPGSITKDIVDGILDADLIIADLTSRNPNVFYELGIAHSTGNKTIMTSQNKGDVPFDISNYRIIFYEQSILGSKKLFRDLDHAIKELLKSLLNTNNPVQEVLSNRSIIGLRKRIPIMSVISPKRTYNQIRQLIIKENIQYVDELKRLNLEGIKRKYKMGPIIMGTLVRVMLDNDAYDDLSELQKFILKYNLDT